MGDPPVEYVGHDGPVPGLPVTQVYGWLLCPISGRVLIQEQDDGTFSLPGGTPEPFDADRDATLAREAFEENTVRIAPSPAELCLQARDNGVAPEVCQSVSGRVRGSPKRVMTLVLLKPVMTVMWSPAVVMTRRE
jgi:8-oxo-dGTP pyrophosphatase MutT (NUDIX family)